MILKPLEILFPALFTAFFRPQWTAAVTAFSAGGASVAATGFTAAATGTAAVSMGATAAAAAGAAAIGAISTQALISGALSVFQAGAQVSAGVQEAELYEQQADLEDLRVKAELVKGKQRSNVIRAELIQTLAKNNVSAAASGLSLTSASFQTAQDEARAAANRELSVARSDTEIAAAIRRSKARLMRDEAGAARTGGFLRAGTGLLETYERNIRRGTA